VVAKQYVDQALNYSAKARSSVSTETKSPASLDRRKDSRPPAV